jgi:hypothetical protein
VKHLIFIVVRVEYLRHNVQLLVVMIGGEGQLRSDVELLVLIESQARWVQGLELLREQIFHDERVVELHTRNAARALPLYLQLGRTAPAVFRHKHVVSHFRVRRPHVRLVVVLLNSSFAITRIFLCHLCVDLGQSLRKHLNLYKNLRLDKVQRHVDRHVVLQHQRERGRLSASIEDSSQRIN